MTVEIIIKKIGLNWQLFKADFPDFGAKEMLHTVLMVAEVQLIGVLVLVFFPFASMSFGISCATGQ